MRTASSIDYPSNNKTSEVLGFRKGAGSKLGIGVFTLAYDPFIGGAEVAVKEIIARNPNFNFTILTKKFDRSWPSRESGGNYSLLRLGGGRTGKNYYGNFLGKLIYVWQSWRTAERQHAEQPFSAVWAIMASYAGIAALFFKIRHPEIPFLLTLQEGDSEAHILKRVGFFYPFWKKIFIKAGHIQAISRYLADFAKRHGAHCPIEVVPNGVDLEKYQVVSIKYQAKENPTIITTSRLVYKNGVDVLIKSLPLLHATAYKLLILGDGPKKEELRDLAVKLGVSGRVEFLGHIEPDKIPSYLSQADIFVRASRSEGLGNSFLEAMAGGLSIIGTAVGGIPDFLKNYNANDAKEDTNYANGLFARVDDPNDLAEKITILLKDEKLRKRLGENGRKLALENYSWDKIAGTMNNIFQKLLVPLEIPLNK